MMHSQKLGYLSPNLLRVEKTSLAVTSREGVAKR